VSRRGGRAPQRQQIEPGGRGGPGEAGLRVHKAIARAGLASRREAERMLLEGRIRLNGRTLREPGTCLDPGDVLEVDGRAVAWDHPAAPELWALYKPKACVSTLRDPEGRRTVKDYFPKSAPRLYPIGRLDYDAEGLLLLTNDGELAQRVAHPSFEVSRIYLVKVKGLVTAETVARLMHGTQLEGRPRRSRVKTLHTVGDKTWLEVVLREGVHHHIKRMFAAVGHPVLKIKRYQIGPVELGDMKPGDCRKLGQAEISRLLQRYPAPRPEPVRAPAQ
jgi:23S rRNA pseudouridine2605 synthase